MTSPQSHKLHESEGTCRPKTVKSSQFTIIIIIIRNHQYHKEKQPHQPPFTSSILLLLLLYIQPSILPIQLSILPKSLVFSSLWGIPIYQWRTTDPSHAEKGGCRLRATMEGGQLPLACMIWGVIVSLMLLLHSHPPRWGRRWRSRRGKAALGPLPKAGVSMTLSCRGRRGLLAIRFMLLREKWRALSERASGGSRTLTPKWSMGGGDYWVSLCFVFFCCLCVFHSICDGWCEPSPLLQIPI